MEEGEMEEDEDVAWYGAEELAIKGSSIKEPFVLIDFLLPLLFD